MADFTDDIFFSTITELNTRLKAREFSVVELVRAFARRLEQLGPRYNALALPLTGPAVKRAKDVDKELKRERTRGMLQGIPFGAKDLLSTAGQPTTYGLVRRHGAMALSWTMDKLGPMCPSAEDCGLVLEAIAGGDSNDPGSAHKSFHYTPQYYRQSKDLRIGYAPVDFAERADPSARPAFEQALA